MRPLLAQLGEEKVFPPQSRGLVSQTRACSPTGDIPVVCSSGCMGSPALPQAEQGDAGRVVPRAGEACLERLQAGIAPCLPRGPREAAGPGVGAGAGCGCRPGAAAGGAPAPGAGGQGRGQTLGTPRRRTGRAQPGQTAIKTSEALAPPRREKGEKNQPRRRIQRDEDISIQTPAPRTSQ